MEEKGKWNCAGLSTTHCVKISRQSTIHKHSMYIQSPEAYTVRSESRCALGCSVS
jgi:hypothetical protein